MTLALQQACGAKVDVQVLCDTPGDWYAGERALLGTADSAGHVREVLLHCDQQAKVAARTVYGESGPTHGALSSLRTLGTRPLGDLLFASGQPQWLTREWGTLDERSPLFSLVRRAIGETRDPCWARRTLFLYEGTRLLVTEIFLPPMFPSCA